MRSFFTEFTFAKAVLYGSCSIYVFSAAAAVMMEPHLNLPCDQEVCKIQCLPREANNSVLISYFTFDLLIRRY